MSLLTKKHADEIREMWQSRALRASSGKMRKVLITALTKEYPEAIVTLAKATWPGFVDFDLPLPLSYATVEIDGSISCDVMTKDKQRIRMCIYDDEEAFIYDGRRLADGMKLGDRDRSQLFRVLQKWVAADKRVGPNGQKLSS